ncbi:MAG: zinc ribbon domain-containing protein [Anaerolineae bacterium]|nr:zinc ribbon domain-containing protein [Anaerolineae bacterium]
MSSEQVYEMLWDCKYCGTKKLLGKTHRFCPNCGAPQDDEARYFPSDDEKVAVKDHVFYGADVICPNCDTLNSANSQFCQQCGTPLTDAKKAELVSDDQVIRDGEKFESTGPRDIAQERYEQKLEAAGLTPKSKPKSRRGNLGLIAILGGIGLVIVFALVAIFWKRETTAYVTGHSWTREISIEEFAPRAQNAWCDAMPSDAYSVSRRSEVRSYRQIPDGEECSTRRVDNGDGTFSERRECRTKYRDEPVYDNMCYFTVNRWGYERSARAAGESLKEQPYWPDTQIRQTGTCIGCEREGQRNADYLVHFRADQDEYTCNLDQPQWDSIPLESTWTFKVGVITNQPDCSTLARAG